MGLSRCGDDMIKNCEEVLELLKDIYNEVLDYDHEPYREQVRRALIDAGVKFNPQTGDAI
jgi:hypothetical protein